MHIYLNKLLENLVKILDVAIRKGIYPHGALNHGSTKDFSQILRNKTYWSSPFAFPQGFDGSMMRRGFSKALLGPKL